MSTTRRNPRRQTLGSVRLQLTLPAHVDERLRAYAKREHISLSRAVTTLLDAHLPGSRDHVEETLALKRAVDALYTTTKD